MQNQSEEEEVEGEKQQQQNKSRSFRLLLPGFKSRLSHLLAGYPGSTHSMPPLCPSVPPCPDSWGTDAVSITETSRLDSLQSTAEFLNIWLLLWSTGGKLQSSSQSPIARSSDASFPQLLHCEFCGLCCTQRETCSGQMDEVRDPPKEFAGIPWSMSSAKSEWTCNGKGWPLSFHLPHAHPSLPTHLLHSLQGKAYPHWGRPSALFNI